MTDVLWAATKIGLTVWTEAQFEDVCKQARENHWASAKDCESVVTYPPKDGDSGKK